jgi:hypothetical protein
MNSFFLLQNSLNRGNNKTTIKLLENGIKHELNNLSDSQRDEIVSGGRLRKLFKPGSNYTISELWNIYIRIIKKTRKLTKEDSKTCEDCDEKIRELESKLKKKSEGVAVNNDIIEKYHIYDNYFLFQKKINDHLESVRSKFKTYLTEVKIGTRTIPSSVKNKYVYILNKNHKFRSDVDHILSLILILKKGGFNDLLIEYYNFFYLLLLFNYIKINDNIFFVKHNLQLKLDELEKVKDTKITNFYSEFNK